MMCVYYQPWKADLVSSFEENGRHATIIKDFIPQLRVSLIMHPTACVSIHLDTSLLSLLGNLWTKGTDANMLILMQLAVP